MLIGRALWFVWAYQTAVPFFDFWYWIPDFERWQQGRLTLHGLAAPWVEHRIVTTRLLLIADGVLFRMRGVLPSAANLVLLAATGLMVHRLARRAGLPALFWIAWFLATCQIDNLVLPFQVQFALVFCCGTATLSLLALAAQGKRAALASTAAGVLHVAAIFSMANGVLLAPAGALLLLARRARAAAWLPWAALAAAGTLLFFRHYTGFGGDRMLGSPQLWQRLIYYGHTLGNALAALAPATALVGLSALAAFLALGPVCLRRDAAPGAAALWSVGAFAAASALMPALTFRAVAGPADAALVSRYGTVSLLFLGPVLALLLGAAPGRGAMPGAAAAVVLLALVNAPGQAPLVPLIRQSADLLANGVGATGPVQLDFYPDIDHVRPQLRFLQASGLSLFAPELRPPAPAMARIAAGAPGAPACLGAIDNLTPLDGRAARVTGWLAFPDKSRAEWVVARQGGTVLGAARPLAPRPDVVAAEHAAIDGFDTAFAAPDGASAPWRMFGLARSGAICALPGEARPSAVWVMPLSAIAAPAATGTPEGTMRLTADAAAPCLFCGAMQRHLVATPRGFGFAAPAAAPGESLAQPFATEGGAGGAVISFRMADGAAVAVTAGPSWSVPAWRAAVLPPQVLAAHPGAVHVDIAIPPGQVLHAGAPFTAAIPRDWSRLFPP